MVLYHNQSVIVILQIMRVKEKIVYVLQSKTFQRITFFVGIVLLLVIGLVAISPEPFLKFGYPGVFFMTAMGGSSLLLIPLASHFNVYLLAFAGASGMAINDSVAWIIGSSGKAVVERPEKLKRIEHSVKRYGTFAIFFWSLIPFPYDIIGFVAGYMGLSYVRYVIPTFLGKFIRFTLIGLGILSFF